MPLDDLNIMPASLRGASYDMSQGGPTRTVRADYIEWLRRGQLAGYHKRWLVDSYDAIRALYAKAHTDRNYGLLDVLVEPLVNLKHLCNRFAPIVVEVEADCWLPETE